MPTAGTQEVLSIFDSVIRDSFMPTVQQVFPRCVVLHDKIKKISKDISPSMKAIQFRYQIQRNESAAFVEEDYALPTARKREWATGNAFLKFMYSTIQMSGPTLELSIAAKSSDALIDVVADMFKQSIDVMIDQENRVMWGDSSSAICQCNGVPVYDAALDKTYFNIDNGSPLWLKRGAYYFLHTNQTAVECKNVDVIQKKVWFAGDVTTQIANDQWIWAQAWTATLGKEAMGLKGHVSEDPIPGTITYQGQSRANPDYAFLKAQIIDVDGFLTLLTLVQALQQAKMVTQETPNAGKELRQFLTSPGVTNAFRLLLSDNNQPIEAMPSKIGYGASLKFSAAGDDYEFVEISDAPEGELMILNPNVFYMLEPFPIRLSTVQDKNRLQLIMGYDAYWQYMLHYWNTICYLPQAQVRLVNITPNAIA